jgi:hypothetical protein
MNLTTYFLDQPAGTFTAVESPLPIPGPGEIRLKTQVLIHPAAE